MRRLITLAALVLLTSSPARAWQQRVAYDIEVSLDTSRHYLHAAERLRYWNQSPDTLRFVWFHLYPNAYRDLSTDLARDAERFQDYQGHSIPEKDRGFIDVRSLRVGDRTLSFTYGDDPTSARVELPGPLAPNDSITFDIGFAVKIPKIVSRLGHIGAHYEITQWYPKIVVYDEKGWHPDGYHYLGEFYGDYGEFTVGITAPRAMKIGACGVPVAADSAGPAVPGAGFPVASPAPGKHDIRRVFHADHVHDFAWCADSTYRDTTAVYNGVTIRVLTLPRHRKEWAKVMQHARDALDYYGRWYGPYAYPTLTICDGSVPAGGGMEYPSMVIISSGEDTYTRSLETTVVHEIGHQWFYGALGNNEMDEAWLDEGINTFSEQRYFEEKYGTRGSMLAKPILQRLLPEYTDRYYGAIAYRAVADNRMEDPVLSTAWKSHEEITYGIAAYMKPALMMWWLRDYLGHDEFDQVMRAYYREYKFRHVSTARFFAVVDSVAHRDVRGFCMPWLTTTERCDYAVAGVKRVTADPATYRVRLQRNESLVFPVTLQLEDRTGKRMGVSWSGVGADTTIVVRTGAPLARADLDPDGALPDVERFNDHWPRRIYVSLLPHLPDPNRYQISVTPIPWYDAVNGIRLGPRIAGREMTDLGPLPGRNQWTFWPYWGFRSREVSFDFQYRTPVGHQSMPPRAYMSLGSASDVRSASLGLRRSWGKFLVSPGEGYDLHLDYNSVRRIDRFWDPRDMERVSDLLLTGQRSSFRPGYPVSFYSRIAATDGLMTEPAGKGRDFFRAEIEERLNARISARLRPRVRAFAGQIEGPAPAQEQYFLTGGFKATGFEGLLASHQGFWSPQEHYHVDGGADLPGYLGQYLRGKVVSALNLSLPLPSLPLSLFGGAGEVADRWSLCRMKDLSADAGVTLDAPLVNLIAPLWINRPASGENRFAWRWLVSLHWRLPLGL